MKHKECGPGLLAAREAWVSAEFLASAVDALSASIAILDAHGVILSVNAAWCQYADENGLAWPDYGVGRNYLQAVEAAAERGDRSAADAAQGIRQVMAGSREHFWLEYPCPTAVMLRWFVMNVSRSAGPTRAQTVIAHQDITERKVVEAQLRAAKEAARTAQFEEQALRREADGRRRVAEMLTDLLTALNSNHSLDEILQAIAERAGALLSSPAVAIYSTREDTGEFMLQAAQGLRDGQVGFERGLIDQAALARAVWARQPLAVADTLSLLKGRGRWAGEIEPDTVALPVETYRALLVVPIVIKEQIYGGILLYYDEPRQFSEDDLEMAMLLGNQVSLAVENLRLREQVEQAAASAERSRLARDLHDAVTQTLFSASVMAEALPRVWERNPDSGREALEDLRQLTRGALAEMRTLLLELRPAALAEKPFRELLRHLTEAFASRTRVPVKLLALGECDLYPAVKVALYRIAQEALNNVAKHADATLVEVTLNCEARQVVLLISDNGRGFERSTVLPDQLGLNIMRERAESIGADFSIESGPGNGTRVEVVWASHEGRYLNDGRTANPRHDR